MNVCRVFLAVAAESLVEHATLIIVGHYQSVNARNLHSRLTIHMTDCAQQRRIGWSIHSGIPVLSLCHDICKFFLMTIDAVATTHQLPYMLIIVHPLYFFLLPICTFDLFFGIPGIASISGYQRYTY